MPYRRVCAVAVLLTLALPILAESPAALLASHGHWKRLRAAVEPRVRANPDDAEAQWLLSRVKLAWHDLDGALAPAEKAVALDPKNADYRFQLAQVVGEQAGQANIFRQMGLARRFKKEAEAALAVNPNHIPSLMALVVFYYRAPGIVGGDKKLAAEMADRVMAISKVDGYLAQVRLAQEANTPDRIEPGYIKAAEADPARFEPHMALASLYSNPKNPRLALAEKEALAARNIEPDGVGPYQILAGVYAMEERWSDLEAILAAAEQQVPDSLAPHLRAAGALLAIGKDLPRAERYTRKYFDQEPEPTGATHAFAHWRLGLILEKEGKKAEAVAEVTTATRLDPKLEQAQKDLKRLKTG
jgi:tetratricopeptide (TPR) repeat protein